MTTPASTEALAVRLEESARAFRGHDVYTANGDPVRLIVQAEEAEEAAALIRRLAGEVEELKGALEPFARLANDESDAADDEAVVTLLYTHPDPELGGPDTLLGELFMRAFRETRALTTPTNGDAA